MANHKSAKKRALQNEVRRLRNRSVKTQIKGIVKNMRAAATGDDAAQGPEQLKIAQSAIDKAAKKAFCIEKPLRARYPAWRDSSKRLRQSPSRTLPRTPLTHDDISLSCVFRSKKMR